MVTDSFLNILSVLGVSYSEIDLVLQVLGAQMEETMPRDTVTMTDQSGRFCGVSIRLSRLSTSTTTSTYQVVWGITVNVSSSNIKIVWLLQIKEHKYSFFYLQIPRQELIYPTADQTLPVQRSYPVIPVGVIANN
jgi:hypothetical protein